MKGLGKKKSQSFRLIYRLQIHVGNQIDLSFKSKSSSVSQFNIEWPAKLLVLKHIAHPVDENINKIAFTKSKRRFLFWMFYVSFLINFLRDWEKQKSVSNLKVTIKCLSIPLKTVEDTFVKVKMDVFVILWQ